LRRIEPARIGVSTTLNDASRRGGAVAPGEMIWSKGVTIGPSDPLTADPSAIGPLLGDTRVLFDGAPGNVLASQSDAVRVIVPYSVAGKTTTRMTVEYKGRKTNEIVLRVAAAVPAIFAQDGSGSGQAVAANEDGSPNAPGNAAAKGSVITISGTG